MQVKPIVRCAIVLTMVLTEAFPKVAHAAVNARNNPDCTLVSRTCVDRAARWIAGQWVSRPCWRWRDQYNCAGPVVDTCQQYVNRGCAQIGSTCSSRLSSGACRTLTQTYRCLVQRGGSFDNCASYVNQGCTLTATRSTTQPNNGVVSTNTYRCLDHKGAPFDNCRQLVARGCRQIGSSCIYRTASGVCTTVDKTFQCLIRKGATTTRRVCGNAAMCVDGNCFRTNAPPANDFAYVVSRFAAAGAAGASAGASGGVSIFKGSPERCNRTILGAKNCCTASPSGWGKAIVRGCPASAKRLAQARQAGQAIYIGTLCANKAIFGACLRKQEVWCVFPSKLARIVQKQGRLQLGIGWGGAQSPDCRGFTPQEFQRLDFSKMDLSEFYADIMTRMTPMSATKLGNRIQTRMQNYYNSGAPNGGLVK